MRAHIFGVHVFDVLFESVNAGAGRPLGSAKLRAIASKLGQPSNFVLSTQYQNQSIYGAGETALCRKIQGAALNAEETNGMHWICNTILKFHFSQALKDQPRTLEGLIDGAGKTAKLDENSAKSQQKRINNS